jgi:dye decolorizing peroxidase
LNPDQEQDREGVSRRRLLGTATAAGVAGIALGAGGDAAARAALVESGSGPEAGSGAGPGRGNNRVPALSSIGTARVPFYGAHQAGIAEPAQAHGLLLALDLRDGIRDPGAAAALMRDWTRIAARTTAGQPPEQDSRVARDAGPSRLTVTFGFGRSLFGRLGLSDRLPAALAPIPEFSRDRFEPGRSGGDLFVQIGADDPLVAANALGAIRNAARRIAVPRWQMNGFNRAPGATDRPRTPRNLMGQIDGTNNPKPDQKDFAGTVFVPEGGEPEWMGGGSYAVLRRIRMLLDPWERLDRHAQDQAVGRRGSDGGPLSGGGERTKVDLEARGADGGPAVAADAHIRLTAPESNRGAAMLRRPFSYHDGFREDGAPDAGLLFVAWQADPRTAFVPIQRKLDRGDALSKFLRHEAGALFAVPGGCAQGEYIGQRLLES